MTPYERLIVTLSQADQQFSTRQRIPASWIVTHMQLCALVNAYERGEASDLDLERALDALGEGER